MDYLLYLSKVLEYISFIAVDVRSAYKSASGIIVKRDNFIDVCADLLRSIWRPLDIDL